MTPFTRHALPARPTPQMSPIGLVNFYWMGLSDSENRVELGCIVSEIWAFQKRHLAGRPLILRFVRYKDLSYTYKRPKELRSALRVPLVIKGLSVLTKEYMSAPELIRRRRMQKQCREKKLIAGALLNMRCNHIKTVEGKSRYKAFLSAREVIIPERLVSRCSQRNEDMPQLSMSLFVFPDLSLPFWGISPVNHSHFVEAHQLVWTKR